MWLAESKKQLKNRMKKFSRLAADPVVCGVPRSSQTPLGPFARFYHVAFFFHTQVYHWGRRTTRRSTMICGARALVFLFLLLPGIITEGVWRVCS